MILAGDIGGTKTRIALYEERASGLSQAVEETYPSHEHAGLVEIVRAFRAAHAQAFDRAGFGIAGPVRNGRTEATNLPWIVDARELARELGLARVSLVNDLAATAFGIAALQPSDLLLLNQGAIDARGNRAVIAAGTGLGEAGSYWDGREHHPFASEGGHADFAPSDAVQDELNVHLRAKFGRVSWERLLSGPGTVNIYEFLRDSGRGIEPTWLTEELAQGDKAATISHAGLDGRSKLCEDTLDLFVTLYGAQAGNLALTVMATGGVFVGGGIAPKIRAKLEGPAFMRAFTSKGRLSDVMKTMPVHVILNDRAALIGAARSASIRPDAA